MWIGVRWGADPRGGVTGTRADLSQYSCHPEHDLEGGDVSGNGRRRGLIKGHGRHRDPAATTIWRPRMPVSSTGVPMYVTAAAGAVVAGLITTVAPSTTAETTRADQAGASVAVSRDALDPTVEPSATTWSGAGEVQGRGRASTDDGLIAAQTPIEVSTADEVSTTDGVSTEDARAGTWLSPGQDLRAGSAVRTTGLGLGSVFSDQWESPWTTYPVAPLSRSGILDPGMEFP